MRDRCLLIDNDAFILLSGAGLLEQAVKVAGFTFEDCRRLPSLEFMLRKPAKAFKKYSADVISRALEACARVPVLNENPDICWQEMLSEVEGIQDGEAVLYAVAAQNGIHFLASNDKKAMVAVTSSENLRPVRDAVAGRILCIEWLVKKLLGTTSGEELAKAFAPIMATEKRLLSIFSQPEHAGEAIASFLPALQRELGAGFLHDG